MKLSLTKEKRKIALLIALGALGAALIFWGYLFPEDKNGAQGANNSEISFYTMEYIETIENKIRSMTEKITGSADVSVIVSAESGTEFIYVSNEDLRGDELSREYITVKNENGTYEPVLVKEVYPEITGISIACPGGDSSAVQRKIMESVSVAFGISKNRICIVGTK